MLLLLFLLLICHNSILLFYLFLCFVSSLELKAHRWAYRIDRHLLSSRLTHQKFQTASPRKPWSRFLPNSTYSICRPGEQIMFLSQLDKNSGCYMAASSCHWLTVWKMKIGIYPYFIADILTKLLLKCSLSSPLPNIQFLSTPLHKIGCHGNLKAKYAKQYSRINSSEAVRGIKLKL